MPVTKILHVVTRMDPKAGGVSEAVRVFASRIAGQCSAMEHEVVSLDPPDADYLHPLPFATHPLGPGKGPWDHSPKLAPWLKENIGRYHAVVVHGLWLSHSHTLRRAWRSLPEAGRPPYFVMPHGMLDPYFQRDPSRRLKAIRNVIYWKFIESKVINQAEGLLFTCEEEKVLAREPFSNYRPKSENVVGLGITPPPPFAEGMASAFTAACPDLGGNRYLLFLSRIHPKKGVDILMEAFAKIAAGRTGDSPLHLVIAGPLDSSYAEEMRKLAATVAGRSGVHIHFTGMLQGDAKWGAFHGCEAFVLPSHQENFGIAVVEALACGKPVIISDKVNIWREIQESGGGLVASDNLTGTEKNLLAFTELSLSGRSAMAAAAFACFERNFKIEVAKERLEQLINTLIPNANRS